MSVSINEYLQPILSILNSKLIIEHLKNMNIATMKKPSRLRFKEFV